MQQTERLRVEAGPRVQSCYCLNGARGTSGGSLQMNTSNGGQEGGRENLPNALPLLCVLEMSPIPYKYLDNFC